MRSTNTIIRDTTKNLFYIFDYLIWLIFDLSKFKKIQKEKIKKVLIIHLGAIGEILISTPLFPALKKALNCEIHYLVLGNKDFVLKNNPHISKILSYKSSFKENREMLIAERYDLAIILAPGNIRLGLLCLLSKIKYRIGCFSGIKSGPAFFLTKRVFPISTAHVIHKNLRMIRQIGIDNPNPKVEFHFTKDEEQSAKNTLKSRGISNYAIVHPVFGKASEAKFSPKFWPPERYAQVADFLVEKYSLNVLLTGNQDEIIFSENIMNFVKNKKKIFIANGKFTFGELGYVLSKAKVLISTSTGVKHLAEAFNVPIVELAGKGTVYKNSSGFSYEWKPWVDHSAVLYHNEVCTGCNSPTCIKKTQECMMAITSQEVSNSIESLLKKQQNYIKIQ